MNLTKELARLEHDLLGGRVRLELYLICYNFFFNISPAEQIHSPHKTDKGLLAHRTFQVLSVRWRSQVALMCCSPCLPLTPAHCLPGGFKATNGRGGEIPTLSGVSVRYNLHRWRGLSAGVIRRDRETDRQTDGCCPGVRRAALSPARAFAPLWQGLG